MLRGTGVCRKLELVLQGLLITTSLLPLLLGNADVILGIQWLSTLGNIKVNWKLQKTKFKVEGVKYTLQGDPSLQCSAVSAKALWKTVEEGDNGFVVEYNGLQKEPEEVSYRWRNVLEEFPQVFMEPEGLPPSRGKEHSITLQPGAHHHAATRSTAGERKTL